MNKTIKDLERDIVRCKNSPKGKEKARRLRSEIQEIKDLEEIKWEYKYACID